MKEFGPGENLRAGLHWKAKEVKGWLSTENWPCAILFLVRKTILT